MKVGIINRTKSNCGVRKPQLDFVLLVFLASVTYPERTQNICGPNLVSIHIKSEQ